MIESKGLWGAVSPGLSKRSTIPRLHQHLKPAPPPPPALPKERPKPKKKGDESYSDEERVSSQSCSLTYILMLSTVAMVRDEAS